MSEMTALERKWAEEAANKQPELQDAYDDNGKLDTEKLDSGVLDRIPKPTGWRLVVLPYQGTKKSKGGIVLADETLERQRATTTCGYVLAVGDLAYGDTAKFPTGPWCQKGDWIVFGRYAGARLSIDGGEIRILNDDEILARIQDPEDILHM